MPLLGGVVCGGEGGHDGWVLGQGLLPEPGVLHGFSTRDAPLLQAARAQGGSTQAGMSMPSTGRDRERVRTQAAVGSGVRWAHTHTPTHSMGRHVGHGTSMAAAAAAATIGGGVGSNTKGTHRAELQQAGEEMEALLGEGRPAVKAQPRGGEALAQGA